MDRRIEFDFEEILINYEIEKLLNNIEKNLRVTEIEVSIEREILSVAKSYDEGIYKKCNYMKPNDAYDCVRYSCEYNNQKSILEYINNTIKCKTLFSTHYHELTKLENITEGIKNIHVSAKEDHGKLIFLYKINEGPIEKSYGIHVAQLAHLPNDVINGANKILKELENGNKGSEDLVNSEQFNKVLTNTKELEERIRREVQVELEEKLKKQKKKEVKEEKAKHYAKQQLDFDGNNEKFDYIKEQIGSINFLETTPMQAFNLLYEIQQKLNEDVK